MIFGGKQKYVETYGAPGQGSSTHASIISVVFLAILWVLSTASLFPAYDITPELDDHNNQVLDAAGDPKLTKILILDDDGNTTYGPLVKPLFLSSPGAIISRAASLTKEEFSGGTLQKHIWESLKRVFSAFFLGVLLGVPLGVFMAINRHARGAFDPPIEFYRPVPPLAYLPLMIVWLGIGEATKITIIFLAVFAPMTLSARAGVRSVPIEQIHAAYSMGATKLQIIYHVILKGAMPEILTGMRISMAFGWTTVVAAELAAAQAGLGAMIKSAADFLVTDVIYVGIIVIGTIAYASDLLVRWIEKSQRSLEREGLNPAVGVYSCGIFGVYFVFSLKYDKFNESGLVPYDKTKRRKK